MSETASERWQPIQALLDEVLEKSDFATNDLVRVHELWGRTADAQRFRSVDGKASKE